MTYDLAPAHADTDAPLPSGIAYEETTELHPGCPRGGYLAWRIDDFTGASVSCCTRCRYRRVYAMTTATAEALRLQAEAEAVVNENPNARPHEEGTGRFVATHPPRPARLCACHCGRTLLPRQFTFASVACRRRANAARRAAAAERRATTTPLIFPPADIPRYRDAVCPCGTAFQQFIAKHGSPHCERCRRENKVRQTREWKQKHRPPPTPRATACVGCGASVERRARGRTDAPARCAPCARLHTRARERESYRLRREREQQEAAAQRAGAGQVAA